VLFLRAGRRLQKCDRVGTRHTALGFVGSPDVREIGVMSLYVPIDADFCARPEQPRSRPRCAHVAPGQKRRQSVSRDRGRVSAGRRGAPRERAAAADRARRSLHVGPVALSSGAGIGVGVGHDVATRGTGATRWATLPAMVRRDDDRSAWLPCASARERSVICNGMAGSSSPPNARPASLHAGAPSASVASRSRLGSRSANARSRSTCAALAADATAARAGRPS
jgi:hypothetical protein